jgi:uroporphyrinogen III methyltransferase/synthase
MTALAVFPGHLPPGHPDSTVDWPGVGCSSETLVLLMAVGNLERIAAFLLEGGRRPGALVAFIRHAGTPRQRVTSCSLTHLASSGVSRHVDSPAVVVIGPTVSMMQPGGRDRRSFASGPGRTDCLRPS